jgi:uncharacterized membrane protein YgcG
VVLAAAGLRAGGEMGRLKRLLKHLSYPGWWLRQAISETGLNRIENAIADSETRHGAEIRVALETSLGIRPLLIGQTARQRAEAVFSLLRVWDTELNNGVLIYLLLADREFEIIADRGLAHVIAQEDWEILCREMEGYFRAGQHEEALLHGIQVIGKRMEAFYPRQTDDANELPNRPVIL